MLSFWEKESFIKYDFVVVGAGIVGLSTAIHLKEAHPDLSVLVLERGLLPTGASTKNAGFLSVSTLSEILSDQDDLGLDTVLSNIEKRHRGIQRLRQRLGDAQIHFEPAGGYELLRAVNLFPSNTDGPGSWVFGNPELHSSRKSPIGWQSASVAIAWALRWDRLSVKRPLCYWEAVDGI